MIAGKCWISTVRSDSPIRAGIAALAIFAAPVTGAATSATPFVIRFQLVDGNNIAELRIGGRLLRAHIDTGGYRTLGIVTEAIEGLPVRFDGRTETRTDGGGQSFSGRTFVVPSLTIAGHELKDVPGYERKQAAQGAFGGPPPFDAILGRDFLRGFEAVVVDYPNKRFELYDGVDPAEVCGPRTTELSFDAKGLWVSTVETDAGSLKMVWDTGAAGASFIQKQVVAGRNLALVDEAWRTRMFRIGDRDLGPIELVALPLDGIGPEDGLIGVSVFATHVICFNLREQSVSIR